MVVVYRSDRAFILNRQTSEVSLKNAKVGMELEGITIRTSDVVGAKKRGRQKPSSKYSLIFPNKKILGIFNQQQLQASTTTDSVWPSLLAEDVTLDLE